MNRKQQKELASVPKEVQQLAPLLGMLPKAVMEKQFKKVWKKKTKCLDDPEKHAKKIKQLQTPQTKKIEYRSVPVYNWLEDMLNGKTDKKFVKWYKEEYYKISLKDLGIFK